MKKLIEAAMAAKADGYEYMTSIVKSVYSTTYHNVVRIDDILKRGGWIPAYHGQLESGAHCRIGRIKVPEKSINKSDAIRRYCK